MIIRDYFYDYFYDYFAIILRLYAIILRLYLSDYFAIIFYDYSRLLFRLFTIISRRRHPKNGNVETTILHPIMENGLVSVDEECLLICIDWKAHRQNGKLSDGAFLYYYTHYSFSLHALFVLAEQDCGLCKYVLCTAFLCTPIMWLTTSLWNIGEAAIAIQKA